MNNKEIKEQIDYIMGCIESIDNTDKCELKSVRDSIEVLVKECNNEGKIRSMSQFQKKYFPSRVGKDCPCCGKPLDKRCDNPWEVVKKPDSEVK